jgi:hypothetical protein
MTAKEFGALVRVAYQNRKITPIQGLYIDEATLSRSPIGCCAVGAVYAQMLLKDGREYPGFSFMCDELETVFGVSEAQLDALSEGFEGFANTDIENEVWYEEGVTLRKEFIGDSD